MSPLTEVVYCVGVRGFTQQLTQGRSDDDGEGLGLDVGIEEARNLQKNPDVGLPTTDP